MARFSLRRIIKEDFESTYQTLLEKLLFPINQATDSLNSGLNNSLTVADNLSAQETVLKVTAPVNPQSPIFFKSTLKANCKGIICINAELVNNTSVLPTSQPFFTFEQSGNQIKVTNISGLVSGSTYNLRVYCFT